MVFCCTVKIGETRLVDPCPPSVPISADDDVAHEEAEQDEPVGVQEPLVEAQDGHAADHLQEKQKKDAHLG